MFLHPYFLTVLMSNFLPIPFSSFSCLHNTFFFSYVFNSYIPFKAYKLFFLFGRRCVEVKRRLSVILGWMNSSFVSNHFNLEKEKKKTHEKEQNMRWRNCFRVKADATGLCSRWRENYAMRCWCSTVGIIQNHATPYYVFCIHHS